MDLLDDTFYSKYNTDDFGYEDKLTYAIAQSVDNLQQNILAYINDRLRDYDLYYEVSRQFGYPDEM